ncbi:MAG: hypothetical protein LBU65_14870 [Planctomycetaceae bacterium]|nr:hypothetical protein [Planctomycetaceae bacterium]
MSHSSFHRFNATHAIILSVGIFLLVVNTQAESPDLLGDRSLERTTFQQSGQLQPEFDLRTDAVMPYGISQSALANLDSYKNAGYVLHLMTGVAWGQYEDYLDGKMDGTDHWDQGQRDAKNREINHGHRTPYIVPSVSFGRYLESGIKKAVDSGAEAVFLEEPEFWAKAGYSESFKRAWVNYYNEPWIRPDSSCDAQYRASKLKHYLYGRTLSQLSDALKEYSLLQHGRKVRFFVPTHSLINYIQWGIVSPESSLLDMPGIDGLICQTWTGTARTRNIYNGNTAERTFETAFLEYGCMQELTRGSGKRMYLLHDPIEDNPRYDWNDYRKNYICTLTASLFAADTYYYEVCPWANRVFQGTYPHQSPDAKPIPPEYATTLLTVFNQLRDMKQSKIDWSGATDGIGVFLSDSALFQRAAPYQNEGVVEKPDDPKRPTISEVGHLAAFYSLALPLIKQGIPVRPTILENVLRYPGYLDRYQLLVLSYEFQKPHTPGLHAVLADWVRRGGTLVYVGGDTDPFHQAHDWWNNPNALSAYATPTEHLFESLGLEPQQSDGTFPVGKGYVVVERKHPAFFSRSEMSGKEYRELIRKAAALSKMELAERNYFLLRRGPYIIASVMNESLSEEPLQQDGHFIDLLDAGLSVKTKVRLLPGEQAWLLDLDSVTAKAPAPLAASGRIENWKPTDTGISFQLEAPAGISTVIRILTQKKPKTIEIDGTAAETWNWDEPSNTILIRYQGNPRGAKYVVGW